MELQTIRFTFQNIPFLEDAPLQTYRRYRIHFGMMSLPVNGGDMYIDLGTLSPQRKPFGQTPSGEKIDFFDRVWLLRTKDGIGVRTIVAHHLGIAPVPRNHVALDERVQGIYIGRTEEILAPGEHGLTTPFPFRASYLESERKEARYVTPVYR